MLFGLRLTVLINLETTRMREMVLYCSILEVDDLI